MAIFRFGATALSMSSPRANPSIRSIGLFVIVTDNPDLKQRIAEHIQMIEDLKAREIDRCLNPPAMNTSRGMSGLFYNGIEVQADSQDKKGFLIEMKDGKYAVTSY